MPKGYDDGFTENTIKCNTEVVPYNEKSKLQMYEQDSMSSCNNPDFTLNIAPILYLFISGLHSCFYEVNNIIIYVSILYLRTRRAEKTVSFSEKL